MILHHPMGRTERWSEMSQWWKYGFIGHTHDDSTSFRGKCLVLRQGISVARASLLEKVSSCSNSHSGKFLSLEERLSLVEIDLT